jgi:hypothetical protein
MMSERRILRGALDALTGLPLFATAPIYRHWHIRWGATDEEILGQMPGDDLVPGASFNATRAITIDAPPEDVWPWIAQMGYGRAGFYTYPLLDNAGIESPEVVLNDYQHPQLGDWMPMAKKVNETTAFKVSALERGRWLVWQKPNSTWAWRLTPLSGSRTRLVTRLKQRYAWETPRAALFTLLLLEFGDFPMMRRVLKGIKKRAEAMRLHRHPGPREVGVYLYWLPLGAGGWFVRLNGRLYERLRAWIEHRQPLDLYHTALVVTVPEGQFVVENCWPIPNAEGPARGVTVEGPVWSPHLSRFEAFRYEVRRWANGYIADAADSVDSPRCLSRDQADARRVLALTETVPAAVWGRDQLGNGDMWNSNSVIAWLLATAGLPAAEIKPPPNGRAPGWATGIAIAQNGFPSP